MIPTKKELQIALANDGDEAADVEVFVQGVQIEQHQDLESAVSYLQIIKEQHKTVDDKRKSFIDPLKAVIDDINDFFRPVLDALKGAESSIKTKVDEYSKGAARRRDEALAAVASVAGREEKTALIAQAAALALPKIKGLSFRESWTGEIGDLGELFGYAIEHDQTLLIIDEKELARRTKEAGKDIGVPGWRCYPKTTVAIGGGK